VKVFRIIGLQKSLTYLHSNNAISVKNAIFIHPTLQSDKFLGPAKCRNR